jgi:hypothetical protein
MGWTSVRVLSAIAAVLLVLSTATACEDELPMGTEWFGTYADCNTVAADTTIQTLGGDVAGIMQEFGKVTPSYSGHPGCDFAYVVDYLMPAHLTNVNPGWDWAWIHVASRMDDLDESKCENSWTSLRVYAYWTFQGADQEKLLLESYRKGSWVGVGCDFGLPDNVWMSSAYDRVRAVSQHGWSIGANQPHYSYFVTNRGTIN